MNLPHPSPTTATAADTTGLHLAVVLQVREDTCDVFADGRRTTARYAAPFPSPRTERVAPGHLVALATAPDQVEVVVFRWYDALILESDGEGEGEGVTMWEPAHGHVLATPRHPGRHTYSPGTRAYLSAGLPGADWWLAGPAGGPPEIADVELEEVAAFCTERGLWDHLT